MSRIRMALLAATAVVGMASLASAQGMGPGGGGGMRGARAPAGTPGTRQGMGPGMHQGPGPDHGPALQGITLTAQQRAQLQGVDDRYRLQMRTLMQEARTAGTPVDQARMTQLRAQHHAEVRALLTPEQRKLFDANSARLQQQRQDRGRRRDGTGPVKTP